MQCTEVACCFPHTTAISYQPFKANENGDQNDAFLFFPNFPLISANKNQNIRKIKRIMFYKLKGYIYFISQNNKLWK